MKYEICLTERERKLVENHLSVVHWSIVENIHVNESIFGLGYDDLFQEGCICLCRAAASYNEERAQFSTYAKAVVRNGLISYCRQRYRQQSHFSRISVEEQGELSSEDAAPGAFNEFEKYVSALETQDFLESLKKDYRGVARLGIEALELKVKGMSVTEIARLYDVPVSHVGAWISRSAQKLKKDPNFLSAIL